MGENSQQKKGSLNTAFRIVIMLVLFFYTAGICIQAQSLSKNVPEELSAYNILRFAKSRAAAGDYYRAATELERLKAYYPAYLAVDRYSVSMYYYLFNGAQYLTLLTDYQFQEKPSAELSVFAFDSMFHNGEYHFMGELLADQTSSNVPSAIGNMLFKRHMLTAILTGNQDALNVLEEKYANEYSAYKDLVAFSNKCLDERKSPIAAIALGIFPGGGYIYADNFPTGFAALVVVSLCTVLSYAAYTNDSKLPAFFIGTVGVLFYGGSIAGGYLSTIKYNNVLKERMASELSQRLALPQDRDFLYREYGIGGVNERH